VSRRSERGAALVIVLFASTLVLLLLMTALTITRMSGRMTARQLTTQGQAYNAASAGLTNALSWFVHQRVQPVVTFNPAGTDTEDSSIGIVRTYAISDPGHVTGRYEIRRSAVTDVSARRGRSAGTVWRLDSVGYVYVQNDAASGPGVNGNTILSKRTMRTEIQRLALTLPANAALNAARGANVNVSTSGRVLGGTNGIGIAYPPSTGTPRVSGTVSGNPAQNTTNGSFALSGVFGVTQQELIGMADIVVDDERDLPDPMPTMSLIVIRNNATFNPTKRLTGSGILVVLGNLTLNPQSNAFYNGLIWVGGTLVISPPSSITGSVIANGPVQLTGGAEIAELDYDPSILDQIRLQKGNYLFSRTPWIVTKGN
jgi:Tfp pilus assembly protein PilX